VTRTRWWGAALRFRAGRKHCRRALLTEVRLQQDKGAPSLTWPIGGGVSDFGSSK